MELAGDLKRKFLLQHSSVDIWSVLNLCFDPRFRLICYPFRHYMHRIYMEGKTFALPIFFSLLSQNPITKGRGLSAGLQPCPQIQKMKHSNYTRKAYKKYIRNTFSKVSKGTKHTQITNKNLCCNRAAGTFVYQRHKYLQQQ